MKRFLCIAFIVAAGFPAMVHGQDSVAVRGWSKDGKVLVVVQYGGAAATTAYTIQDLVSDEVQWEENDSADVPSAKFSIQDYKAEPSDFPFRDKRLGSFDIDIQNSGTGEDGTKYKVIVSRAGGGRKALGSFTSQGLRPTGDYKTMWFKSPFENRLLVIVAIEYLHPEFDYKMYDYHFLGCHLGVGFGATAPDPATTLAPLVGKSYGSQGWAFSIVKNEEGLEFVFGGPGEVGGDVYQIKGCSVKGDNDYLLTLAEAGKGSQVEIVLEGKKSAHMTAIKNFNWGPDLGKMVFELDVQK